MKNNEVAIIENLNRNNSDFELRWRVTSLCNYQCDFCIQGNKTTHLELAKGENAKRRDAICDAIVSYVEKIEGYDTIKLHLIGGEVSILIDFPQLLEKLVKSDFQGTIVFNITTNLSQPAEYYCRLFNIVQKGNHRSHCRKLILNASYYSAYTSWEQFDKKLQKIENHLRRLKIQGYLRKLCTEGLGILFHRTGMTGSLMIGYPILSDEDYWDFKELQKNSGNRLIRVNPIRIRQFRTELNKSTLHELAEEKNACTLKMTDIYGGIKYFENIQALGLELEEMDRFCPRGYLCDAGMHGIWINAFGEVYRCPSIGSSMKLGSVLEDNWDRLGQMMVCKADHCSCNEFGLIKKEV